MKCKNCGHENELTSRYCIKCGVEIAKTQIEENASRQEESVNESQKQEYIKPVNKPKQAKDINYLMLLKSILLTPITAIKANVDKFNNMKFSILFTVIISGVITVIKFLTSIFSVLINKKYNWLTGERSISWNWEAIKKIKWFEIINKNLFFYVGVLLAIAAVYYLSSLIVKKNASFQRLLGIASISIIPMIILTFVISPIMGIISSTLGFLISVVGIIYTILLLIDGINRELKFEDEDARLYTNLICLCILASGIFYTYFKLF